MDILDCLFQSWILELPPHPIVKGYMKTANINLSQNIMAKKFYILHTVKKECEKLFCASSSAPTSEQHHAGIHLVINVAKTSQLTIANHGDTQG